MIGVGIVINNNKLDTLYIKGVQLIYKYNLSN